MIETKVKWVTKLKSAILVFIVSVSFSAVVATTQTQKGELEPVYTNTKTVNVGNETNPSYLTIYSRTDETVLPNGTRRIDVKVRVIGARGWPQDVVECEGVTYLPPNKTEAKKESVERAEIVLPTYDWDSVQFLHAEVTNGLWTTKYTQPDNYNSNGTYPGLFNLPWALQGTRAVHIHIPEAWIADWEAYYEHETSYYEHLWDTWGRIHGLAARILEVVGIGSAGALIAELYGAGEAIVAVVIMAAIDAGFEAFVIREAQSKLDYVKEYIQTYCGDGFAWIWPPTKTTIDTVIAPSGFSRAVWFVKSLEFTQSWGKHRDIVQGYKVKYYEKADSTSDKIRD